MWPTPLGDEGRGIASERMRNRPLTKGHTMYEYEIQQLRAAELIRRADQARLAREAVRARRAARRDARHDAAPAESHTSRLRRHRFARAA